MLLLAVLAANLVAQSHAIANLHGEPSVVSAAGVTADERPILTIENRTAFDPADPKLRVVIRPASDGGEAAAAGVLDALRWMKTKAPAAVRRRWIASAIPSIDGLDEPSLKRWLTFQAPDLVVEVSGTGRPVDAVRAALERAPRSRSADREGIASRVARDPLAIAKLLAPRYPGAASMSYIPAVAWSNTLRLAALASDAALRAKVEQQTAPWRLGQQELFGNRIQLTSVAGTLIFADLAASGDEASRPLAIKGAEAASAIKAGDVYAHGVGWTDDMFMASVVLARTAKIAGREHDLDVAARMLASYASRLQRPDGVFVHATNAPVAWGRGNGFAALGLTEVLGVLPTSDPRRAALLEIYRRQMDAVRRLQSPDGMWNEVLDEAGSYREESATAMLLTAMSRGVRARWIDASYKEAIERAWRGLAAHVAADGTVIDVCTSTGAGPTKRYYLDRAAITGPDDRGGAMALLAAMEMVALRHAPAVVAK